MMVAAKPPSRAMFPSSRGVRLHFSLLDPVVLVLDFRRVEASPLVTGRVVAWNVDVDVERNGDKVDRGWSCSCA